MTRVAILPVRIYCCRDLITGAGNHRVATIFRFAADGSCDRNQHPHLNDRVFVVVIISDRSTLLVWQRWVLLRVWWWTTRLL